MVLSIICARGLDMPNYEYRCLNCRRRFDIFMSYAEYGARQVNCPHCQSEQVQRKIGRIRFARSEESRTDEFSGLDSLEGMENDPQALGKMMRKMSSEMGEDMGPEFHEVVNRLESGQSPEQIEKDLPDLGEALGGDDPGGGADFLDE
jgi:putative FmdB family regulatory protein